MTPDWALVYAEVGTAVATLLAVVVALIVAGADARKRSKEQKRYQAEQINAWMEFLPDDESKADDGEFQVRLIIQNASKQLAYNLVATVVTAQGEQKVGNNYSYRNFIGRTPPGRTEYKIKHPGYGMHKRYAIELAFEDSAGITWIRRGKGALEQAPKGKDPVTVYDLSHPVGWWMP